MRGDFPSGFNTHQNTNAERGRPMRKDDQTERETNTTDVRIDIRTFQQMCASQGRVEEKIIDFASTLKTTVEDIKKITDEHGQCRKDVDRLKYQVLDEHDCSRIVAHANKIDELENEVYFMEDGQKVSRIKDNTVRLGEVERRHNLAMRVTVPVITSILLGLMAGFVRWLVLVFMHVEMAHK